MLPVSVLARTTHLSEIARFSEGDHVVFEERAHALYGFYLCPECLTQEGVLRRALLLPHIKSCPQHRLTLQYLCQCRASLQLFHRQAWPFTCSQCGASWGKLPRIEAPPERLQLEEKLQAYYAFFFSEGTSKLLVNTLALIRERAKEKGKRLLPSDALSEAMIHGPRYQGNDHQEYQDFVKQKRVSLGKLAYSLIDLELSIGDIVTYIEEHYQRAPSND